MKSLWHPVEINNVNVKNYATYFITGALGSKGTDWKETDMNKIPWKLVLLYFLFVDQYRNKEIKSWQILQIILSFGLTSSFE